MIFNEQGFIDIDEMIAQEPSFQKIMEDGVVTDEEVAEQKERVIALLKKLEQHLTPEQIDLVRELLAEISVLVAVRNIYEKEE